MLGAAARRRGARGSRRRRRGTRSSSSRWRRCSPEGGDGNDPADDPRAARCATRPAAAEERAVLERAAVAGKHFVRSALRTCSPKRDQRRSTRPCSASRARTSLAARPGREDAYRFRHVLIRDAAYAGIPKELPRQAARTLRRLGSEHRRRQGRRPRRDRRLPPRAGFALPRAAGAARRRRGSARRTRRRHARRGRAARLRARRRCLRPSTCSTAPSHSRPRSSPRGSTCRASSGSPCGRSARSRAPRRY